MVDGMKSLIQQNKLEKEKNTDLLNVVETQTERITELTQETIPTKKNRKEYTPRMRNSSMILKRYGMSERNASKALKEVVEEMSQKKLDGPMPSTNYHNYIKGDMKALALQQVKEVLDSSETLTLKYDGTTKKGLTLMEVELATETETLLCGARQQVGGTAEETVDTIKEVIEDIESISTPTTSSNRHIQTKNKKHNVRQVQNKCVH